VPLTPSHNIIDNSNPIKAIVQYAREYAPKRRGGECGRPPKYQEWKLVALCILKAYLNVSFDKLVALAPYIVDIKPSKATIYMAWLRLAKWAEQDLVELQGSIDPAVVDSTGIRSWRRRSKLHMVYSLEKNRVLTVEVTEPNLSDAKGLRKLLRRLRGLGILVADAAYFGVNLFKVSARRDLLCWLGPVNLLEVVDVGIGLGSWRYYMRLAEHFIGVERRVREAVFYLIMRLGGGFSILGLGVAMLICSTWP